MIPKCQKCNKAVRPNINMRNDMHWLEAIATKQNDYYIQWLEPVFKRSLTVIEIGAGPVQPIAREFAEGNLKNDKYRCALIRINPIKERRSQYLHEREEILKIVNSQGEDYNPDNTILPDYLRMDNSEIVREEEKEYKALKNDLIEIQMGAKDALKMLKKAIIKE